MNTLLTTAECAAKLNCSLHAVRFILASHGVCPFANGVWLAVLVNRVVSELTTKWR
jgi:hypothetical protein